MCAYEICMMIGLLKFITFDKTTLTDHRENVKPTTQRMPNRDGLLPPPPNHLYLGRISYKSNKLVIGSTWYSPSPFLPLLL